ncbi:winged helix DNA-binding protein [Nocardia uniformis]|uniref:Winged helix DNA-binding protein n=1 Tax=Nocardia uniformis TaxID=53432 RepID=A0A849CAV9_9NOCA|nr:winged helix DNA-binding protein [Nocardia uniformis]NNH74848.1 winged helix DNA-binding protein [Nocardia uniformis]
MHDQREPSRLVAELESHGLVQRESNPDDGRSALVALTDLGRKRFREAAPIYLDGIDRRLGAHLDAEELEVLASALRKVLGPTDLGAPSPRRG